MPGFRQLVAHGPDVREGFFRLARAIAQIGVVDVAVIHVEAGGAETGKGGDQFVQLHGPGTRRHSGAVHAAVEVEEQVQRHAVANRGIRQRANRSLVVYER